MKLRAEAALLLPVVGPTTGANHHGQPLPRQEQSRSAFLADPQLSILQDNHSLCAPGAAVLQPEIFIQSWNNSTLPQQNSMFHHNNSNIRLFIPQKGTLLFVRLGICPFLTLSEPPVPKQAFQIESFTAAHKALKSLSSGVTV